MLKDKARESLEEFLELSNFVLCDTSTIGMAVFGSGIHQIAHKNTGRWTTQLSLEQLRRSLQDAQMYKEMLVQYKQVRATPIIITELKGRVQSLKKAVEGMVGFFYMQMERTRKEKRESGETRSFRYAPRRKKQNIGKSIRVLKKLAAVETDIREVLKERVYVINQEEMRKFTNLVIGAWQRYGGENEWEKKNHNDERIVAAALYAGLVEQREVFVLSRDKRFKEILLNTQRVVQGSNCAASAINELLERGKVSIIGYSPNAGGYFTAYSSCDFEADKSRRRRLPSDLAEIVTRCEALVAERVAEE